MFVSMTAGTPLHRQLPKGVRLRRSSLTWLSPAFLVSQKYLVALMFLMLTPNRDLPRIYLCNLKLLTC